MRTKLLKSLKIYSICLMLLTAGVIGVYYNFFQKNEFKYLTYDEKGNEIEVTEKEYLNRKVKKHKAGEVKGKSLKLVPGYEEFMKRNNQEKMIENMNIHLSMPSENDLGDMPVNNWVFKGPYSANSRPWPSMRICGRIRDLEIEGVPSLRAGTATGGLFSSVLIFPYPISDNITTLSLGAFATDPSDSAKILLGTGEPENYPGNGMWRTTNGGQNWTQIATIPNSGQFREIRYQPGNSSIVHAACSNGYYKSVNGGSTWTQKVSGNVTGLDLPNTASNIVIITKRNDGVYKSNNTGDNFSRLNNYPLTGSNFKTASVSLAYSNNNYIYVSASGNDGLTKGQHRSTDGGNTWQDRTWKNGSGQVIQIHGTNGQGDRNNCIGVSPTNPDLVIVGGVDGIRTTNGGLNWAYIPLNIGTVHDDFCVVKWRNNGNSVYLGTDGGISISNDGGATYNTATSIFPAMQFWGLDAAGNSSGFVITGGTQDNSIVNTFNNGSTWYTSEVADASHTTIDKNNPAVQMSTLFMGGAHSIFRTTNYGANWTNVSVTPGPYGGMVKNDFVSPVWYYVNNSNKVYYSTNTGSNWIQLGAAFPDPYVGAVYVGRYSAPFAPVYAIMPNTTTRIMFYDGTNWVARNSGLPAGYLGVMGIHPTDNNIALISTAYDSYPGQKIYRTTNKGVSWTNISGDLPNFSITSLVMHPANNNVIFASTTWWGVYKTTNGGANWFRWMNGMPQSQWVEAMAYVDSSSANGKFYVVAGTHGRGAYVRESGGDDPLTGNNNNNNNLPRQYSLQQNYPNPFNPSTTINFDLPVSDIVTLQIFDITGKLVKEVLNNKLYSAGSHSFKFDGIGLSSGAYFYRITTPKYTDVKKMVLVK